MEQPKNNLKLVTDKKNNARVILPNMLTLIGVCIGLSSIRFALDGKFANLTINDVQRRNRITRLLSDWGLISILKEESIQDIAPLNQIKVLPYKDKNEWKLEQKYNIGKKNKVEETVS